MRTLGPIGHLSAKVRRYLEIDEEEAILGKITIKRKRRDDQKEKRQSGGGRFMLAPDFTVPGPFSTRPTSALGQVSFHFSRHVVTKGPAGTSILHAAAGAPRLSSTAPADHDSYVSRPGAVMVFTAANFDDYVSRDSAIEVISGRDVALFTNISADPAIRRDYWRKVHEHERSPMADALEFHRSRLSASVWRQIAAIQQLPVHVKDLAAAMAAGKGAKGTGTVKTKANAELDLDRVVAVKLLKIIRKNIGDWDWKQPPLRIRKGRGGRTQFRMTAEFPSGIDAAARMRITAAWCQKLDRLGVMYTAAIHAPDHHNDERNFHLHVAYHDRPAKQMVDGRWDFEIREKVVGQHNRYRYPHRQPKISALSRDPDGGDKRKYAASEIYRWREEFADLCNSELTKAQKGRRFDPRSYQAMGVDQPPTSPLGPKAAPLEAAGIPTDRGIANAEIIWTTALQRNIQACKREHEKREAFLARIGDATTKLVAVGQEDLAQRLHILARCFEEHAQFLVAHELEIGEYLITWTMAQARPEKTLDTCSRLLSAIENGKASQAEIRERHLIKKRMDAAEDFLDSIDRLFHDAEPVLGPILAKTEMARSELATISADVNELLEGEVKVALERPPVAPALTSRKSDRDLIDDLLNRIVKDDLPVLLPDADRGYRVPGISRGEYHLLNSEKYSGWVQARLAGIADIQHDRMRQATRLLGEHGREGLDVLAVTNSDARRAQKHLAAYEDHPALAARTSPPECQAAPDQPTPVASSPSGAGELAAAQSAGSDTSFNAPVGMDSVVEAVTPKYTLAPTASRDADRDNAIAAFAEVVRTDPRVRFLRRDDEICVDPKSVPGWQLSAEIFADESEVRDAITERFEAQQENDRAKIRARIIDELGRCRKRPIERCGGRWVIQMIEPTLIEFAHKWQDHEDLATAYDMWDRIWTGREMAAANQALEYVPAPSPREKSIEQEPERNADIDVDIQAAFLNSRNGRGL